MLLLKNRSSLFSMKALSSVGLFFYCTCCAVAQPALDNVKLAGNKAFLFDISAPSFAVPDSLVNAASTSAKSTPAEEAEPTDAMPFKQSQVGGAPISHSLEEYFKVSKYMRTEIERFCGNISARAGDTRSTLQIEKMLQLKADIEERIKTLEAKRAEYETWLAKRNNFLDKTKNSLIEIITKMKPGVAAQQLALVDHYTAASLILKLNPRVSSAIMNELPPQTTAAITQILVNVQKLPNKTDPASNKSAAKG